MATQGGGYIAGGDGKQKNDRAGMSNNKHTGLVAVNINQLRTLCVADQNCIVVHKRAFNNMFLVARVIGVESFDTRVKYMVIDHTGGEPLAVNIWNVDPNTLPAIQPGDWVRCFGNCRDQGDEGWSMVGYKVEKVKSINEITQHLIERALNNTVLAKRKENIATGQHSTTGFPGATGGPVSTTKAMHPLATNYGAVDSAANAGGMSGMSSHQNMILQAIAKDQTDAGKSLDQLSTEIRAINKSKIKDILDFLSSEGHIYTTIDESHFKATDS